MGNRWSWNPGIRWGRWHKDRSFYGDGAVSLSERANGLRDRNKGDLNTDTSKKKKKRSTVFNIVLLVTLIGLTSWVLLRDHDMPTILHELGQVRPCYLFAGMAMVLVYVCSESVIIKILLKCAQVNAPLHRCIMYSFIGFFYSMVTPSATGGQPMQVYYMRRDGIRVGTASVVLMLVTIEFKSVLIIMGLALAIFFRPFIIALDPVVRVFFWLGLALNVIFVTALEVLVFCPRFAHKLVRGVFRVFSHIRFLHLTPSRLARVEETMDVYREASSMILGNGKTIVLTQLITFFQRFVLFALTYLAYVSLGLSGAHLLPVIGRQAVVSISSDMLPTPGGLGFYEFVYMRIFLPVFGSDLMTTLSLTISRGFSYYFLLLVSGIVTFVSHILMTVRSYREYP